MDSFEFEHNSSCRRIRRSISANNLSQNDTFSLTNLSELNSLKRLSKSKAHNHLTESQYQELMRKNMIFKRLNARKESRHTLLERKRNIKETEMGELHIREEEEDETDGEDVNDDVYVSLQDINEQSEREVLNSNTHLSNTELPSSTPCFSAFTSVNINQEDTSTKKSFGSNLVKKMTTIRNKFNMFVKNTKLPPSTVTKSSSVDLIKMPIQNNRLGPSLCSIESSKPQQTQKDSSISSMRRSTSAFNVTTIDKNKYMRKQNSITSTSSMSSISGCSSTNASMYNNHKRVAHLPNKHYQSSNLSLVSKENKRPPFRNSFRICYNDKHLYQKVSYERGDEQI